MFLPFKNQWTIFELKCNIQSIEHFVSSFVSISSFAFLDSFHFSLNFHLVHSTNSEEQWKLYEVYIDISISCISTVEKMCISQNQYLSFSSTTYVLTRQMCYVCRAWVLSSFPTKWHSLLMENLIIVINFKTVNDLSLDFLFIVQLMLCFEYIECFLSLYLSLFPSPSLSVPLFLSIFPLIFPPLPPNRFTPPAFRIETFQQHWITVYLSQTSLPLR